MISMVYELNYSKKDERWELSCAGKVIMYWDELNDAELAFWQDACKNHALNIERIKLRALNGI